MPSALSIRLDERRAIVDAHNARPDLIHFLDGAPKVEATSAFCREGKIIVPAEVRVTAGLIPDGNLRLVCISGVGDAIWTRGVLRETLKAGLQVWIDSAYDWCFWDFEGVPGFHYWSREQPAAYGLRTATYLGRDMSDGMPVYAAMCQRCKVPPGDFRLPTKLEWTQAADAVLAQIKPKKPVMIYRPLVHSHGRRSVASRNPDHAAYAAIYAAIRARFHVISVRGGGGEDLVHADAADTVFHEGELALTTVAALMSRAALVYTCAGMGLVLGAGVGTPVLAVMGGYEDAGAYSDTCVYAPSLLIDPITPCRCYADNHDCQKAIDIPAAIHRAQEFCDGLV